MAYDNTFQITDGTKSIPLSRLSDAAWTPVLGGEGGDSRQSMATKSFRLLGVMNRCVMIRANAVASLPWTVSTASGENVYSTDDAMLPKELQFLKGFKKNLHLVESSLSIFARSYLFINPKEKSKGYLQWMMSTSVDPIWDQNLGIVGFRRNLSKDDMRDFPPDRVAYFSIPNPLHETLWGPSPVSSAADAANVYINLNAFANQFIERGAIKATLLRVDPSMRKEDRETLKTWWSDMMNGVKNAWQTRIFSTAVEPTVVGEGLKDIADKEISRGKAEELAISMGVPFSVLFSNAANHATAITDQRNFYTYTILPEAEFIAEELNEKVFEPRGLIFAFEEEAIKIFQDSEMERAESYKHYVETGMRPSIAAQITGLKLPPQLEFSELDEQYEEKKAAAEEMRNQMIDNTPNAEDESSDTPPNSDDNEDEEATKEAAQFRRWVKKRINGDSTKEWHIDDFAAQHIDSGQKRAITAELLREQLDDDENEEDDEVSFRSGLKERQAVETSGSPDENPLTEKVERETTKQMMERFKAQYEAVFAGNEDNEEPESVNLGALTSAPARVIDPSLSARDALRNALVDSAALGTTTAISALEGFGIGFNYELTNIKARDWANREAGKLISGIDRTTERAVKRAVAEWIENGEPLSRLKKDLESTFGRSRAELIASTEVTRAYAEGNRIAYADSGVVEQIEWRAAADERVCPICGPLHGKRGNLKTGFRGAKSGFPPAHPRCRCWIVPVINVPQLEQPVEQPIQQGFTLADKPDKDSMKLFKIQDADGYSRKTEANIKEAMEDLTRVHSYQGTQVKFEAYEQHHMRKTVGGSYYPEDEFSVGQVHIYGNFSKAEQRLNTWHEFGHALDQKDIKYAWNGPGKKYNDLRKALTSSRAIQRLEKDAGIVKNATWHNYVLDEKEQFARAYSQWVAVKLDDKEVLKELEKLTINSYQWAEDDFEKIEKEFDKLFGGLGWLR